MVDSFSISYEFGDSRIHVTKKELESLPESVEALYDELISRAKEVSPYYAKCLQDFVDVSEGSVRAFFSENTRLRVQKFCKKEQDEEFFKLYESLYQYVRSPHDISVDINSINAEKLISIFGENFPPEDIKELQNKSKEIGHFPLFLAFDKLFRNSETLVRDYALTVSYIYLSSVRRNRETMNYLEGDEAKAFNKLVYKIGRLSKHINRLFTDVERTYKNLRYWEINEIEGTSFSQSFIYWIIWKYGDAWFLGEYASGFPKWCFSHDSIEICFPPRNLPKEPFDNLYNYLAETLASPRDNYIETPIVDFLQYKDPPDDAKIIYDENGPCRVELVPGKVIKINPSKSVMGEVKRLIRFIGNGITIKGQDLIIPPGDVVLIPQEKLEKLSPVEIKHMWIEKWRKEEEERILKDKEIVESSPIVENFITWVKSQEWYESWTILFKRFLDTNPENYLHSYGVSEKVNNQAFQRVDFIEEKKRTYSFNGIFYPSSYDKMEFPDDVLDFFLWLSIEENEYFKEIRKQIKEKKKMVAQELESELNGTHIGFLLKATDDVIDRFNNVDNRNKDMISECLWLCDLKFAPYIPGKHICIYKSKTPMIDEPARIWRWMERYASQYSLLRIAAQMVKITKLDDSDVMTIKDFLSTHKVEGKACLYFTACFIAFSKDGPGSRSYDFSNLSEEQKLEYYSILNKFAAENPKRIKILEKHKYRFDVK